MLSVRSSLFLRSFLNLLSVGITLKCLCRYFGFVLEIVGKSLKEELLSYRIFLVVLKENKEKNNNKQNSYEVEVNVLHRLIYMFYIS